MEYLIGSGAILESGAAGSITPAALHAQIDATSALRVRVAAVDFEGTTQAGVRRLLVMAQGWTAAAFRSGISEPLRTRRECSLADVFRTLANAAGSDEVHLFAHWQPDAQTCEELHASGVCVVAHPLESIDAASVVTGQRHRRWRAA